MSECLICEFAAAVSKDLNPGQVNILMYCMGYAAGTTKCPVNTGFCEPHGLEVLMLQGGLDAMLKNLAAKQKAAEPKSVEREPGDG